MAITGFCITQNSVTKGEPFVESILQVKPYVDEILVIDMESDDSTRQVLYDLGVTVKIASKNDEKDAFLQHERAKHENIIYFQAYEVYSESLLKEIHDLITNCGIRDISVLRIVIEQNFQRIRCYPEYVHRVFRRGTAEKRNNSTNKEHLKRLIKIGPAKGYLWACQNCFIDNVKNQYSDGIRLVQSHFIKDNHVDVTNIDRNKHWAHGSTPIAIPKILMPHVGRRVYTPYLSIKGLNNA